MGVKRVAIETVDNDFSYESSGIMEACIENLQHFSHGCTDAGWSLFSSLVLLMEKFVEAVEVGKIPLVKLQRIVVFV